ncbi:MAG: M28 family peptidase, partial [Candidatus Eiseniibacteriota bacterium]
LLIALALCLATGTAPAASSSPVWISTRAAVETLAPELDLLFEGLSGRIVRNKPDAVTDRIAALVDDGVTPLELAPGEVLFVYWVADARQAEVEPPARILVRSGRELVVATTGDAPRLTAAAAAHLPGLQQPVRVPERPIVWPAPAAPGAAYPVTPPPAALRQADPLIQSMVDAMTTDHYMATWQTLEDFVTRYTQAPQNELATQWLLDTFQSFGLDAEFHVYEQGGPKRNVIATLPGVVDPSQVVYICAHLDATSSTPNTCAPGADDNGSGTAAVVEAARIMSQYLFEYTIKFACWNGEEQGLVGSGAYVADIAAQGENVIGAFNMDMIAYRGTDPAPPDLIIYTNTASQGLATTLETACNDYVPGALEPVVLLETLSASDHASFWNHGYQAILAIEEEAWGADFCPWYHTCDDMIFRYPQDYVLDCSKVTMAATATTAVPVNPTGPYLVLSGTAIDDDAIAPSNGDGDGTVNPGETVELWVTVRNVGNETAQTVSGALASASGLASVITSGASWNDIPAGDEGENLTPFVFEVDPAAEDGSALPFELTMTDASGSRDLTFELEVVAPRLAYHIHALDDATGGNANGVIDVGETIELAVTLLNSGSKDAAAVDATLSCGSPYLTVMGGQAAAATIPTGAAVELSPAYQVQIGGGAPGDAVIGLDLEIAAGAGYQASSGFKVQVGTHFYDDLEADGAWSLAAPDDDAETGRWVRVDPIGTEYNSQPCQPEDDHTAAPWTDCMVTGQGAPGGAAGDADVDAGKTTLTTPVFDLSLVDAARVTYWRWYTNDLGNNPGEDVWQVQVSSDGGGSWVDLENTTQSANSWQERSFLIEDYVTPTATVAFRFVASDEGSGSLVEAAVDDFVLSGAPGTVGIGGDGGAPPLVLRLRPARPSPLGIGAARIGYTVPDDGRVSLKLYAVDGRLVRTLVDGAVEAGVHDVAWDGTTNGGARVAPGVYFYTLRTGERELSRKLVVVE